MIAKYYFWDNMIRIYDRGDRLICTLPYPVPIYNSLLADDTIDSMRLRRNNDTWRKVKEHGAKTAQCKIRFK